MLRPVGIVQFSRAEHIFRSRGILAFAQRGTCPGPRQKGSGGCVRTHARRHSRHAYLKLHRYYCRSLFCSQLQYRIAQSSDSSGGGESRRTGGSMPRLVAGRFQVTRRPGRIFSGDIRAAPTRCIARGCPLLDVIGRSANEHLRADGKFIGRLLPSSCRAPPCSPQRTQTLKKSLRRIRTVVSNVYRRCAMLTRTCIR